MWLRKRVVLQHDETDCGPAVLAMMMRHHKRPMAMGRIRELAQTDASGTSLYGLCAAAEALGFRATGFLACYDDLASGRIACPVIAPVINERGMAHFVLLLRANGRRVVIADPASGIVRWSRAQFLERWRGPPSEAQDGDTRGALLVVLPSPQLQRVKDTSRAKRLLALVRPRLPILGEALACAILGAILALGSSVFVQVLIDRVVVYENHSLLQVMGLCMLLVLALRAAFNLLRQYLLVHLAQKIDVELFVEFFSHVIRLPLRFFRARRIGEILSRLNDAQKIRTLLEGTTLAIVLDALMFLFAAAVLFSYHLHLALLVFAFVPLFALLLRLINGPVRRTERDVMEALSLVEAQLVESLAGITTVKACGAERWALRQTETAFVRMARAEFRSSMLATVAGVAGMLLAAMASLSVLWYGGSEVLAGHLSLGQLMFFSTLLAFLLGPMERLAEFSVELQEAGVAIDRLFEILELEPEEKRDRKALAPATVRGEMALENVTFAYGFRDAVLKHVTLHIPAGSTVALVGDSGSGKSTLASLLTRFYEPNEGRILLDGIDLRDWDLQALRQGVSMVPQDNYLFRGKIRDNIALSRPKTSLEEIVGAAKLARAHEFISHLPDRYETLVGERALDLSGGERQRLAIARALLANPRVLILDEATSNLDSENEAAIQDMLRDFHGKRTTILIAHRLSTLMHADKIVVLHEGEVVEEGSHDDLMARRGRYFDMWQRQLPSVAQLFQPVAHNGSTPPINFLEERSRAIQARCNHGSATG
jgi:ATP-binding cassette subfamily B protein